MTSPCVRLLVHVVWSTMDRKRVLDTTIDDALEEVCRRKADEAGGGVVAFGAATDHVHLILRLGCGTALGDLVGPTKGASSRALNQLPIIDGRLKWQSGYWADSIHPNILPAASRYVLRQRAHHIEDAAPECWEIASRAAAPGRREP